MLAALDCPPGRSSCLLAAAAAAGPRPFCLCCVRMSIWLWNSVVRSRGGAISAPV